MPIGGAAEAGDESFCSCVSSWSPEGLWILSFGRRNRAQCPVRCVHGLEPSDRPAYCRNAPVLRRWSNRLGRPNAEIAQPCPQHTAAAPLVVTIRLAAAAFAGLGTARGEQAVALRFDSARLDRSERGAAEQTHIAKRNPCLLRSRSGRGKLIERRPGSCPLGSDMKLPASTCT
jgi:hypothetical protein